MTKKHFIALAQEISRIEFPCRFAAAQAVANVAQAHNPRFDRRRFFIACDLAQLAQCVPHIAGTQHNDNNS